ncbi:hypothetical protein EYV94_09625 [Puteibacter caeruleilacunae]|nr:hypothetical protein EYV94_09625 [Puteibacter caeruleilacunae]
MFEPIDPNSFFLDWERLGEVLVTLSVFAIFVERALSILFESRFFISRFKGKSLKELIAFLVGVAVCFFWKFDALSFVFPLEKTTFVGYIITGAIIAGGSKGSVILFQQFMKVKSTAQRENDNT